MPLPDIQLDDRTFEDLVAEARRRISAYTPEWTDYNESDPGIALIELFAWLEELILWRLNRAPQKSYIQFLNLAGLSLNLPTPAQAELTFKLTSKDLANGVPIPQGTQVSMASSGGSGPVVFATTDNLLAVGGELQAVQTFDGAQYTLQTESNRLSSGAFYPLSQYPQRNSALYLGFDRPFPLGDHRLTIHGAEPTATTASQGVQGGQTSASAASPPVVAYWEYWNGARWNQLTIVSDATNNLAQGGAVIFTAPSDQAASTVGLAQKTAYYWIRFRIDQILGPGYEEPPQIEDVLLNTIPAINAVVESDELLGASNGMPNQTFTLSHAPVLPHDSSIVGIIAVYEGSGYVTWTEVDDLISYGRTDTVYTLDYSTGTVTFGDGEHGKIPQWLSSDGSNDESADLPNIKASSYMWGGGAAGNAGPGTITSIESSLPYVDSVTNLRPSLGGQDEETVEQVQARAPQSLRAQSRAVTADDFEFLATQTPGTHIGRAKALPMYNPSFEISQSGGDNTVSPIPVPGAVTVMVVPNTPQQPPLPSTQTLNLVAAYLDKFRLITTELYVAAPKFRKIEIEARVTANPTASVGAVQIDLQNRLLAFFNPLTGGTAGTGWDFGGTIYFSETYRQILIAPGVLRLESQAVKTYLDDVEQPAGQDIPLATTEIVYSVNHTVIVSYP